MIQDKIFFDEKDPTGLSYNTPFTYYGSYQGRLWSKAPGGEIKYYTQNSDLSAYATTGSNQFNGSQTVTGSLTVTGGITGTATTASYVEYANVANRPALISGSAQIADFGYATTGSNGFNGSQSITGSLTVTGQVVAQTLNVQQVTSSIVFSSGSNIFGNSVSNTQQFTGSLQVSGSSHNILGFGKFDVNSQNTILTLNNPDNTKSPALSFAIGGSTRSIIQVNNSNSNFNFLVNSGDTTALSLNGTTGAANFSNSLRIQGSSVPANGSGTELAWDGTNGYLLAFNRTSSTYLPLFVQGSTLNFGTGDGTTKMFINSSGNVGIGTSSPVARLDTISAETGTYGTSTQQVVARFYNLPSSLGSGNNSAFLSLQTSADGGNSNPVARIGVVGESYGSNNGAFVVATRDGGGVTERMRITSGGNVGIGTNNPATTLEVRGSGNTTLNSKGNLFVSSGGTASQTAGAGGQISFGAWLNGDLSAPYPLAVIKGVSESSTTNFNNGSLIFGTMDANTAVQERMRINSDGAVLIGHTGNDYGRLDVTVSPSTYSAALGLGVRTNSAEGNSTGISFKTKISLSGAIWENARIAAITEGVTASAFGTLAFYTMNATTLSERMRITSNGKVGIANPSPNNVFDIYDQTHNSNTVGILGARTRGGGTFITGRTVTAEISNQTQTIATMSASGGNERIFIKVQVVNVSAVSNYGNVHVGYALWIGSGGSTVTTMTLDSGNSNINNTLVGTLSWSGNNLQYTTNRAGNYELNSITIWASARDTGVVT